MSVGQVRISCACCLKISLWRFSTCCEIEVGCGLRRFMTVEFYHDSIIDVNVSLDELLCNCIRPSSIAFLCFAGPKIELASMRLGPGFQFILCRLGFYSARSSLVKVLDREFHVAG